MQPSCSTNDEGAFNICLDLTTTSQNENYEPWMNTVIRAVAQIEKLVTGDLPPVPNVNDPIPTIPPNPLNLFESCTEYLPKIDDLYICALDIDLGSQDLTLAFAGPYLYRSITKTIPLGRFAGEPYVLPYAARIAVNSRQVKNPDLQKLAFHELLHALGL